MRIIFGLLIITVGVLVIRYVDRVTDMLGWSSFGDKYFGSSDSFYKFVGFVIIIIGMLLTTGLLGSIVLTVLGPLFSGFIQK